MRTILTILAAATLSLSAMADSTADLTGEAVYYDDGNHSRNECMRLCAEQARIEALANKFGTEVGQTIIQTDRSGAATEFLALSMTEVKGEWLADTEEPKFTYALDKEGCLIVTCKVRGRARAITNSAVAFDAKVLRNGKRDVNAATQFVEGDDMYVLVNPSTDGYLSIFLEDETRTVYELLPYPRDTRGEVKLRGGREYLFFSLDTKGQFGPEEEMYLTTSRPVEYNRIYVVYSPEPYALPLLSDKGLFKGTTTREFTQWLLKSRRNDKRMGVKTMNIEIREKQ